MPRFDEARTDLVAALLDHHGPTPRSGTGPSGVVDRADPEVGRFVGLVRAALDLVADPRTAASALACLEADGLLDPSTLAKVDSTELDDVLREGRVKIAAKTLRPLLKLARWASESDLSRVSEITGSTEALRESWRGINGLGPATVDALLLHGLGRAAYPVDRATFRVLARHGWIDSSADYDEARSVAEAMAPEDPTTLAILSGSMARLGREFCKPAEARCDRCPLRSLLPEGRPREFD